MTYVQQEQYYDFLEEIRLARLAKDFDYANELTQEMHEKFPKPAESKNEDNIRFQTPFDK